MLSPADVLKEADFSLGKLHVSPAARHVQADGQTVTVEPRVMQVLLFLSRQRNEVVTRNALFDEIWGGAMVGDDSLNRAVAGVRKVVALDPERLSLETIPRTGYRLNVAAGHRPLAVGATGPALSRRTLVGGAVAMAGVAVTGLLATRLRASRGVAALVAEGKSALSYGDPSVNPVPYFERAAALRPDDSEVQGLLAYALAMRSTNPEFAATALPAADRAAQAALAIDPDDPYARVAMTFVHQTSMDLIASEDALRAILRDHPDNVHVMRNLWNLLQCVGRSREAQALTERALKIDPVAAIAQYPLAQLLWINGRMAEADRVIDQALRTWPTHRFVRFARFILLAFTGRARAALAMLDGRGTAPQGFSPKAVDLWRVSLEAIDRPTPESKVAAVRANVDVAGADLSLTSYAAMVLCTLGEVDKAFDLTNAFFVVPSTPGHRLPGAPPASSAAWRFAPWLFIPPTAPMRADSRFSALCDTIGLSAYWAKRGIRPDNQMA